MRTQRWLARLSLLLIVAAVAVLAAATNRGGIGLLVTGLLASCVMVACAYWFLARRGLIRGLALALLVLTPAGLIFLYVRRDLLWDAAVAAALVLCAVVTGRVAMGPATHPSAGPRSRAGRPRHAYLIMNPRSGGGKVGQFRLREKAEALGARVEMLTGPEAADVAAMARRAVAAGADLLGVAGGDGTQALVAGVAAEHDLPFLCISAGTRNHFAIDLGLDPDDPAACLDALTHGVEQRIDLGRIGDRIFVNNASFGAYAEIVRRPEYRDDKRRTVLDVLPDLLTGGGGRCPLTADADGIDIDRPQALLVSNNPYLTGDIAGLGRRSRLDTGALGVVSVRVSSAAQAVGLIQGVNGRGLTLLTARRVTVRAPEPEIAVGIDGETVLMPTPVDCSVMPGALRVVIPAGARAVRASLAPFRWSRLAALAGFGRVPAATGDDGPGQRQRSGEPAAAGARAPRASSGQAARGDAGSTEGTHSRADWPASRR